MRKKLLAVFAACVVCVLAICPAGIAEEGEPSVQTPSGIPEGFDSVCENDRFILSVDRYEGIFTVYDKSTGCYWHSSPEDRYNEKIGKGVFKMSIFSLLTLSVMDTAQGGSESQITSYTESVLLNGTTYENIENGLRITVSFTELGITLPLELTLTDTGFALALDVGAIKEGGTQIIRKLTLLPYFGAGNSTDEGYLLVPDGCGSLIYFNNGRTNAALYDQPIYGGDRSVVTTAHTRVAQQVYLPVFGLWKGEQGFLAIVTDGAANGVIHAESGGRRTGYNAACTSFELRSLRTTVIGDNSVTDYEKQIKPIGRIRVEYRFCEGGYSGMARTYREYLGAKRQIGAKTSQPLYLTLLAAQPEKKSFLGIGYETILPLTTFDQAASLAKATGAEPSELSMILEGWSKAEMEKALSTSADALWELGGWGGLETLSAALEGNVALAADLVSYRKSNFFSSLFDDARNINNVSILRYDYSISTGQQILDRPALRYLGWSKLNEKIGAFADAFRQRAVSRRVYLSDIVSESYADYTRNNSATLSVVSDAFARNLAEVAEAELSLLSGPANGYALPYLQDVIGIPVEDSNFDLTDESVPFYQLAVSGLIGYSVPAINLSSDPERMFLKALETGSGLHYYLAEQAGDAARVEPSLYSVDPDIWMDTVRSQLAVIRQRDAHTEGSAAVEHRKLAEGVYCTTHGNGKSVIVNYSNQTVTLPEGEIPAGGYLFA